MDAHTAHLSGDSYSVSADCDIDDDERPAGETWVDLIASLPEITSPPRICNFSSPGATAEEDLASQLTRFVDHKYKGWDGQASLDIYGPSFLPFAFVVFFFGINDCGQTTADRLGPVVGKVLEAAQKLHTNTGARNFAFIDVPPTDRAPAAVQMECGDTVRQRVDTWNAQLREKVAEWAGRSDVRATIFSSNALVAQVLDEPERYGFKGGDLVGEDGGIWADELHLSSAAHAIVARRFFEHVMSLYT
ncbi:hypothetical protein HDZ31DRAFT_46640 [Schizophyllum fasciatum]